MRKLSLVFVIGALMISSSLYAQRTTDVEGSKDHPLKIERCSLNVSGGDGSHN
jgi:hypothetical protein